MHLHQSSSRASSFCRHQRSCSTDEYLHYCFMSATAKSTQSSLRDRKNNLLTRLKFCIIKSQTNRHPSSFCFHPRCSCWRIRWQRRLQLVWRLRPVSTSCCCRTGTCCSTWPYLCSSWKSWKPVPQKQHNQSRHNRSLRLMGTVSDRWEQCKSFGWIHVRSGSPTVCCSPRHCSLPCWQGDGVVIHDK